MPVRLKDLPKSQRTRMQHAEWLGNSTTLIIIVDNDIYLRQSPADEADIRLTHTGVPGLIYNGITDWLYQGKHLSSSEPVMAMKASQLSSPFALARCRGNFKVTESAVGIHRRLHTHVCNVQRYKRRSDEISLVFVESSYTVG